MNQIKEIPIICINLARAKDRREYIEKEWIGNRGCPVHFIEACDRRDIEEGRFLFPYNKENSKNFLKRELTSGEIATVTSHVLALEYAKRNNFKEVIIIEDDVEPKFPTYNKLNEIMAHMHIEFPKARVAMLHQAHPYLRYIVCNRKEHFRQVKRASYGTCSYYVDSRVYDTFINSLLSFECPSDWYWSNFINEEQLVIPKIPLAIHIGKTTYIGNDYRGKVSHRTYIA
jgi:GR25 family glycosyltransferase involved in LPS biosynthesis